MVKNFLKNTVSFYNVSHKNGFGRREILYRLNSWWYLHIKVDEIQYQQWLTKIKIIVNIIKFSSNNCQMLFDKHYYLHLLNNWLINFDYFPSLDNDGEILKKMLITSYFWSVNVFLISLLLLRNFTPFSANIRLLR